MAERLQKIIAESGLMSRRAAELAILEGRVLVNGQPANLGDRAESSDRITLDGKILPRKRALIETVNNKLKNICQIEGGNVTKKHRFPPSSEKFPSVVQRSLHSKHVEMLSASFF